MPSKTSKTSKKTAKKRDPGEAARLRRNRMWSSVIFILGILILFLTYIKGQFVWLWLHNVLWGLMGVSAVIFAPTMLYVALMLALDRSKSAVITKIIQGTVLMLLLSPAFEIIYDLVHKLPVYEGEGVSAVIASLYENGKNMQGGGALSIVIGGTLTKLCGTAGALIIIILLIMLFAMLLTNITFVDVWNFFSKLFRHAGDAIREDSEERELLDAQRAAEEEKRRADEERKRRDSKRVDIAKFITDEPAEKPADEFPPHPVVAEKEPEQKPEPPKQDAPKPEKEKKKKKSFYDTFDEPAAKPDGVTDSTVELPAVTERTADLDEVATVLSGKKDEKKSEDKKPEEELSKPLELRKGSDVETNPIYVDEDGQTSWLENGDALKSSYNVPPIELLNPPKSSVTDEDTRLEIQQNSETLVETLRSFGVTTRLIDTHRGPSVTRYELQPAAGVKVSRITGLVDDIALNLAAEGVRIEAPIPGKAAVGIELANKARETVYIRELIDSDEFRSQKSKLGFPVGKDIEGKIITGDIAKMPHLLIAGTTGSGKSVFTNSIIMSILYHASPEEVKLILVDPKQVEFPVYNGIPHLLIPVVTDAKKAAGALGWAVTEMMRRYKLFSDNGVRDLGDYNDFVKDKEGMQPLPKIVIVVDELADLMMAAPKEVEESICRIAQLARAAGMHLIIATQSPRVDIVTGLIKANIPSRAALKVSNQVDSRVILDEGGAEKLLGNGDLLYKPVGVGKPVRIQGSYVATDEIKRVVDFLKSQTESQYDDEVADEIEKHIPVSKGEKAASAADDAPADNGQGDLIERAIECIVRENVASTTFLQRRLKLGYARAARIMDELEEMGVVGPADGAKPREIRMSKQQWLERKTSMGDAPEIPMGDGFDE